MFQTFLKVNLQSLVLSSTYFLFIAVTNHYEGYLFFKYMEETILVSSFFVFMVIANSNIGYYLK